MILLYKGKSLISWRIKMATLSQYSHAAWWPLTHAQRMALLNGHADLNLGVIEAWHKGGVRHTKTLADGHKPGTVIDVYDIPAMTEWQRDDASGVMMSQVGKPYWFKGLLSVRFNRALQALPPGGGFDPQEWFCSMLCEWGVRMAGSCTVDTDWPPWAVWPGMLGQSVATRKVATVTV